MLTDGGHIENLGIYSLLKRRCNVIIAIDAEADPIMSFHALLKLERFARIDLGVIIDLPREAIRDQTLECDEAFDKAANKLRDPVLNRSTLRGWRVRILSTVHAALGTPAKL